MQPISIGERFPSLEASGTDGNIWLIPEPLGGRPAVLIFYRGHW